MTKIFGMILLLVSAPIMAFAGLVAAAPEVDPSTAVGGVALVGGALLVLRARRRR